MNAIWILFPGRIQTQMYAFSRSTFGMKTGPSAGSVTIMWRRRWGTV